MDSLAVSRKQEATPRLCKPCNRLFPGWDALRHHKEQQRKAGVPGHIHCKFCGQDFVTERAEILHLQQFHAQEQNLQCPGCGHGPFTRLGALMSHIEKGQCARIDAEVLEEVREKKLVFSRKLEALTNEPIKNNYTSFVSPSPDASSLVAGLASSPGRHPFVLRPTEFPRLPLNSNANSSRLREQSSASLEPNDADTIDWDKKKNLFPKTPAANRPTAEQLQAATAPSARDYHELMDIDHPDHPRFRPEGYYSPLSDRYLCPKTGCHKTFKKIGGITSHLGSTVHGNTTYRCPSCFRGFKSLTAITMHVESNGTFCHIRDSNNYDAYLDQLTAGMVDVDLDRHEDGTVVYKTAEKAREIFRERGQNITDENLKGDKEQYWADKTINW